MKKILLLISFALLIPSVAHSQTVQQTLEYDYLATTPVAVATYTQSLKINTAAAAIITPVCAAVGANTHCTLPLTTVIKSGDILVVSATNGAGSSSGSLTYNPGSIPTAPTTIAITIIIKVP